MAEEIEEIAPDEEVTLSKGDLEVIDSLESDIDSEPGVSAEETTETAEIEAVKEENNSVENSTVEEGQTFNPDLVSRAEGYGLDPSSFATEKSLGYVVNQFDQGNQQLAQWNDWYRAQQQPQGGTEEQSPQQPRFVVDLNDDYDEGLKTAINAMAANMQAHYDDQLNIVAQSILDQQQFVSFAQQQQGQQHAADELEQFNTAITKLSNEDLFGSVPYEQLDPSSPQAKNMESVYEQVTVIANGYRSSGKQMPDLDGIVKQAYHSIFADEIGNHSRNSRNDRLRANSRRRLGGGSSTATEPQTGDAIDDAVNSSVLKDFYDSAMAENGNR
jgi:hypothetical protein